MPKRDYNMRLAKKRQRQGYKMKGPDGHWSTVDPKTGKFLKSRKHPTLHKEIDWYKSKQGESFRKKNKLVTKGPLGTKRKYYKYEPRK